MGILLRVDDKLCHGQVTYLWIKKMKIDRLIIADDRLVADNFSQVILKLSKPAGVEQEILTVRAAIKRLADRGRLPRNPPGEHRGGAPAPGVQGVQPPHLSGRRRAGMVQKYDSERDTAGVPVWIRRPAHRSEPVSGLNPQ